MLAVDRRQYVVRGGQHSRTQAERTVTSTAVYSLAEQGSIGTSILFGMFFFATSARLYIFHCVWGSRVRCLQAQQVVSSCAFHWSHDWNRGGE